MIAIPMDLAAWFDEIGAAAWLVALEMKVSLLLACALLAAALLRRASARLRHALWGTALAGTLALPALPLFLPAWPVALLPATAQHPRPALEPNEVRGAGLRAAVGPAAQRPERAAAAAGERATPRPRWLAVKRGDALLGFWLLGAVGLLVSLAASLSRVRRLTRGARQLEDEGWTSPLRQAKDLLGIVRPIRLLVSREVAVPMTAGVLRPIVFLPREAAAWSEERRRLVLLHELVHVRRGDWPLQLLGLAARALHWCNPLAWIALRSASRAREESCDEGVLASGARPSVYAKHLLAIADSVSNRARPPVSALAMARRSQLEDRFMSILTSPGPRSSSPAALVATLLGVTAIVLSIGAAEPVAQVPAPAVQAVAAAGAKEAVEALLAARQAIRAGVDAVHSRIEYRNGNLVVEELFENGLRVSCTTIGGRLEAPPVALETLPPGTSVHLSTALGDSTRDLTVTATGESSIVQVWQVDGRRQPLDEDVGRWRDAVLEIVSDLWQAASLRGEESSLRGEISGILGEESSLRGEISTLRGEESSLRGEISTIQGEESSLRGEISTVLGKETSLQGEISSIRGEESGQRGRISSLRASGGDHGEEIRQVERQIQGLDVEGRVRELERRIQELDVDGKVRQIERRIEALDVDGKVREVQRRIEALDGDGKVRAIERQIAALDVEGKVREIERRIEALDADRRAVEIEERMKPRVEELRKLLEKK